MRVPRFEVNLSISNTHILTITSGGQVLNFIAEKKIQILAVKYCYNKSKSCPLLKYLW